MKIDKAEKIGVASTQSTRKQAKASAAASPAASQTADDMSAGILVADSMNSEDLDYIRAHGARAYAELLQNKIVGEIRDKLLVLMGLKNIPESELPLLQRQTIEGLIAVEIQARLEASLEMEANPANDNSTYLKTMLLTQGNYGFFNGQPVRTLGEFEKDFKKPAIAARS